MSIVLRTNARTRLRTAKSGIATSRHFTFRSPPPFSSGLSRNGEAHARTATRLRVLSACHRKARKMQSHCRRTAARTAGPAAVASACAAAAGADEVLSSASSALAEPFGAAAPLRVGAIENLMPAGELRMLAVGEMLGGCLQDRHRPRPVKRPPFGDDAVGERNPALGPFADARTALRCRSGSGRKSMPSAISRSKAT
jgi:hypothetical protein